MNIDFQEILKELEYRVPNGIINLNEEHQVTTLIDILRENGVSDANELAQKARAYFGFINEADADVIVKNKLSGHIYKVKKMDPSVHVIPKPAEIQAAKDFYGGKLPVSDKDPKVKGKAVFGGKGASVFPKDKDANKETPKKESKGLSLSKEETKRLVYDKKGLADIVKSGLIPSAEKKLTGAGVFDATEEQMQSLLEVTQKQIQDPNYRRPLPKYDVTDNDIDTALDEMKKLLGKEFTKVKSTIQKAGGVDPQLTTGERGVKRVRDIIKLYLQTGGRSAVTGKIVPFNQMQLDHHVPYSSAAKIVKDKTAKGVKTTLLDEQSRLDSLPNWDLMETSLNQLKNSLEGNALIDKINKKLSASPEEKEMKKLEQEVQNIRQTKLLQNLVKSFGKGDFSGMNEETIEKMSGDEIDIVMKAWNWWHPNTGDANQFRKSNPEYDKILKKSGIKVPPPDDPNTIIRNTAQVGGSRSRGVKRPVPERKKLTIKAMRGAKVPALTKKEAKQTDTVLLKAIRDVEAQVKDKTSRIDQIKQKLKSQKKK
jgi:hypothetical protein